MYNSKCTEKNILGKCLIFCFVVNIYSQGSENSSFASLPLEPITYLIEVFVVVAVVNFSSYVSNYAKEKRCIICLLNNKNLHLS